MISIEFEIRNRDNAHNGGIVQFLLLILSYVSSLYVDGGCNGNGINVIGSFKENTFLISHSGNMISK